MSVSSNKDVQCRGQKDVPVMSTVQALILLLAVLA